MKKLVLLSVFFMAGLNIQAMGALRNALRPQVVKQAAAVVRRGISNLGLSKQPLFTPQNLSDGFAGLSVAPQRTVVATQQSIVPAVAAVTKKQAALITPQLKVKSQKEQDLFELAKSIQDVPLFANLIKNGACLKQVNTVGQTLLHKAVQANNIAAVKLLLEYGADPLQQDYFGSYVFETDNPEMQEFFKNNSQLQNAAQSEWYKSELLTKLIENCSLDLQEFFLTERFMYIFKHSDVTEDKKYNLLKNAFKCGFNLNRDRYDNILYTVINASWSQEIRYKMIEELLQHGLIVKQDQKYCVAQSRELESILTKDTISDEYKCKFLQLFASYGFDIYRKDMFDKSLLYHAVKQNNTALVQYLVKEKGFDKDEPYYSAPVWAKSPFYKLQSKMIKTFIDLGIDPNVRTGTCKVPVLVDIIREGNSSPEVIQLLIEAGADVTARGEVYGSVFSNIKKQAKLLNSAKNIILKKAEIMKAGNGVAHGLSLLENCSDKDYFDKQAIQTLEQADKMEKVLKIAVAARKKTILDKIANWFANLKLFF